jgi:general secretion pathway protein I
MRLAPPQPERSGLTLLEVLVALSIFLIALIGIGQLLTLGGDRARDVADHGQAIQLCQTKLAEVVAGVVPLASQSNAPVEDDPAWQWSLDAEQGATTGLWNVTVRVSKRRPDGSRVEASLSQMILDPSIRGNNQNPNNTNNTGGTSASGQPSSGNTTGGSSP